MLDPVDLAFDERGRIFVLEMPGYPFGEHGGRVITLAPDASGRLSQRQVFADELGVADSILPHRGGLLVAAPPDLLFLADDDGDGVAERREVVLTGFADANTQHNFNGLTYGLDNWIHAANGGNGGSVSWPDSEEPPAEIHFDDVRFRTTDRRFERNGRSSGGFGLTFDSFGRLFSTHNLEHLSQLVLPGRYTASLPVDLRDARRRLAAEGSGPARIFPIGMQETRVNHPEQSGHFSGACGIVAYTGGALGPEVEDNLFVADVVLNLVHRSLPSSTATGIQSRRAREGVEFLASEDRAFRPVNLKIGPDGALWIVDMHRNVIEHPEWIPDEIEAELDIAAGRNDGRIYRVVRADSPSGSSIADTAVLIDRNDIGVLIELLGHDNSWWRLTAQRLLVEEQHDVGEQLTHRWAQAPSVEKLHLVSTAVATATDLETLGVQALTDPDARVREHALRTLEEPALGSQRFPMTQLFEASIEATQASDWELRVQGLLTLGHLLSATSGTESEPAEGAFLERALSATTALLLSLEDEEPDTMAGRAALSVLVVAPTAGARRLLEAQRGDEGPTRATLAWTFEQVTALLEPSEAISLLDQVERAPIEAQRAALRGLTSVLEASEAERGTLEVAEDVKHWLAAQRGLDDAGQALDAWRLSLELDVDTSAEIERLESALERSGEIARPVDSRRAEIALARALPRAQGSARARWTQAMIERAGAAEPEVLQLEALEALAAQWDVDVTTAALASWRSLGISARERVSTQLLRHRPSHGTLLDALEAGVVQLGEMNFDLERRRALLRSRDPQIASRAERLFTDAGVVTRQEALARLQESLLLEGSGVRGQALYLRLCARCHRKDGFGNDVGPDLTGIGRKSPATLLHDIVDPNAAVEGRYLAYNVEVRSGEVYSGLLEAQDGDSLLLRQALGLDVRIDRADVVEVWTDSLSLMPEELEQGLSQQAFADLLAFLAE